MRLYASYIVISFGSVEKLSNQSIKFIGELGVSDIPFTNYNPSNKFIQSEIGVSGRLTKKVKEIIWKRASDRKKYMDRTGTTKHSFAIATFCRPSIYNQPVYTWEQNKQGTTDLSARSKAYERWRGGNWHNMKEESFFKQHSFLPLQTAINHTFFGNPADKSDLVVVVYNLADSSAYLDNAYRKKRYRVLSFMMSDFDRLILKETGYNIGCSYGII